MGTPFNRRPLLMDTIGRPDRNTLTAFYNKIAINCRTMGMHACGWACLMLWSIETHKSGSMPRKHIISWH